MTRYLQDPAPYRFGMEAAYGDLRLDLETMRRQMAKLRRSIPAEQAIENSPYPTKRLWFSHSIQCGMLLPFAAMINYLLSAFPPQQNQPDNMDEEAEFFVDEILKLGKSVQCFRPLGTEWVPSILCVAWATTTDATKQTELNALMREYNSDFPGADSTPVAVWTRRWLQKQRATLAGSFASVDFPAETDAELEAVMGPSKSCCIL